MYVYIYMTPGLQSFSSVQAQSCAVIDSRPVLWKNYSLNQFNMSSAYDFKVELFLKMEPSKYRLTHKIIV